MNEIYKLKTEHARYKKALETLRSPGGTSRADMHRIADCALCPPPAASVTLALLIEALKKFSETHDNVYIMFFSDESGGIKQNEQRVFTFNSLQEAYNFLTSAI